MNIKSNAGVLMLGLLMAGSLHAGAGSEWSYEGSNGPAFWGDLDHAYEACSKGMEQSPVDLVAAATAKRLPELEAAYKKAALTVVNNGHTL